MGVGYLINVCKIMSKVFVVRFSVWLWFYRDVVDIGFFVLEGFEVLELEGGGVICVVVYR